MNYYYIYIDNSSLWTEGRKVSAVHKGDAVDVWDATEQKIFDNNFRIDFGQLLKWMKISDNVAQVNVYGYKPSEDDSFWGVTEGLYRCEVKICKRNLGDSKERMIVQTVIDITEDSSFKMNGNDCIILISGDTAYIPCIENVINKATKVKVAFWSHAPSELKRSCSEFIDLDKCIKAVTKTEILSKINNQKKGSRSCLSPTVL